MFINIYQQRKFGSGNFNGTAVLGLETLVETSKPVMEGKGLLSLRYFADIDVLISKSIRKMWFFHRNRQKHRTDLWRINLEDIKAPGFFEIERRLKRIADSGDARRSAWNGYHLGRCLTECPWTGGKGHLKSKIVISGAGAEAISCTRLYKAFGAKTEHIVMLDSKGRYSHWP